jgi:signal transduction histidine kinase
MKKLRVLMVEDSADDAQLTLRHLKANGYAVDSRRVETAADLWDAIRQGAPAWDLVLSDYSLPSFSAPAALEIWRKSELDLPFIVVTGAIGEENAVELMKVGAHDFVLKNNLKRLVPVIERELREALNRQAKRNIEQDRLELLERLREAVRLRDEFLSIASHELRTPLTALSLQLGLLQERLDHETLTPEWQKKIKEPIARLGSHVERLVQLSGQLVDVSYIRTGRLTLEWTEGNLSQLVEAVAARMSRKAQAARCSVALRVDAGIVGRFDASRMEQVVTDLLLNAFKYGSEKPVEVTLQSDGTMATLTVKDGGIGIAAEDQARIFERFERAASVGHYGGLGLSLYLSRQILTEHGGSIHVDSLPGAGATFVVRLPVQAVK